jgi:hypothetical protein
LVCIPNRSTKSPERKREQKERWFRNGQKWRTGCEGRISVVKRRHGLNRRRYKGFVGMIRWVGFCVIADNVINIAPWKSRHTRSSSPTKPLQRPPAGCPAVLLCRKPLTSPLRTGIFAPRTI